MFLKRSDLVNKQLKSFRNASVSHCFRNSSLTIIWNDFGLSDYKRMKRNLQFRKNTCYNSKRNYLVPCSKESPLTSTFVASLNHSIVLGRIFC